MYSGKAVDHIEVDFFLVNVNNGQPKNENYDIMNSKNFPVENRPQAPQKPEDGLNYLSQNSGLRSLEKFANFHLLLFIAKRTDVNLVCQIAKYVGEGRDIPAELEREVVMALQKRK